MAEILEAVGAFRSSGNASSASELVMVSAGPIVSPRVGARALIIGWHKTANPGAAGTITLGIRRRQTQSAQEAAASGTLIGERNAENNKAGNGQSEEYTIMAVDSVAPESKVFYELTKAASAASGIASYSSILVILF